MGIFQEPTTNEQALTLALTLALIGPDEDERYHRVVRYAEELARGMDAATVEICKAAADERAELLYAQYEAVAF